MTSANHDTPTSQPDENQQTDPARDELDLIDETVAQITDADVDERLRNVLSQAGYRSRHTGVTPSPQQAGDRSAANPRRRPSFSRFLISLSGADAEILDRVPSERVKFASLGWAVLITGGMAVVSMWFALTTALGVSGIPAAPVALLWGLVILGIDRWLVRSMPVSSTWRMLALAAPRLVLALLLGVLISTPLVLQIFQQEINAEIPVIRQQQLSEFLADPQRSQLDHQVTSLQGQVDNLDQVIDSHGEVPVNPSTDPVIQSLTTQRNSEIALEQKYYLRWQCEIGGIQGQECSGSSGIPGTGPLAQADRASYEDAVTQVNNLNGEIQNRENQLAATDAAAQNGRLQQAEAALPEAQAQLRTAQDQLNALLDSFSAQNSADNGVLIRLEALDRLSANDSTLSLARLLLFLLFLVIECLPVTVKLLQRPGLYEEILAHKIIDERLQIAAAAQEQVQLQRLAARQKEHPLPAPRPQDTTPAQGSSKEPLTVPDHIRDQIDSISPFMRDPGEMTAPAYREELENCFFAIAQAVDQLRRKGFDSDQITEALRITADTATRQLTAARQATLAEERS